MWAGDLRGRARRGWIGAGGGVELQRRQRGGLFSCAIKASNGSLNCWGYDSLQQTEAPASSYKAVSAGQNASCAIKTSDSSIACWGYDPNGQTDAPGGSYSLVSISAYSACAIQSSDGALACGGYDGFGVTAPPAGAFSDVAVTLNAACAIRSTDGSIACWGEDQHGELSPPSGSFSKIDAHGYTYCAISSADGSVDCWGDSSFGQTSSEPAGSFSDVGVGQSHVCALKTSDSKIVCWGSNGSGQGTPPDQTYISVDAGENHTCAVRSVDGRVDCWGDNFRGQTHAPPVAAAENSSIERDTDRILADGTSTATMSVELKDQYGDAYTVGGNTVTMHTTLGTIFAASYVGGGVYQSTLRSSTTPGTAFVTAEVNGFSVAIPEVAAHNYVHFLPLPLTAMPSTQDFGSQMVGRTSPAQGFTVTNNSAADLTISTVALQGPAPGDFTRFGSGCVRVTLHPGGTCQVSALFSPQTVGFKQATLRVSGSGEVTEIALSGTAIAGAPLSLDPTAWDFSTAYVGSSSPTKSVSITNTSDASQTIKHVELEGADAADFVRFAGQCLNVPLAPGGACSVTAVFRPQSAGAKSAQLVVRTASGAVQSIALSGVGSAAAPLSFTPASASVGSIAVGASSTTRSFVVQNASGHAVLVTGATLTDGTDWVGYLSGCRNVGLLPGQSCTVSVRFTPKSAGAKTTRIKVTSDSGVPQYIDLSGVGVST